MGLLTFKGGIHPDDGKAFAQKISRSIRTLLAKRVNWCIRCLSISVRLQIRFVKKGDHVLKGQKIAEAGGFVSCAGLCFCVRNCKRQSNIEFQSGG